MTNWSGPPEWGASVSPREGFVKSSQTPLCLEPRLEREREREREKPENTSITSWSGARHRHYELRCRLQVSRSCQGTNLWAMSTRPRLWLGTIEWNKALCKRRLHSMPKQLHVLPTLQLVCRAHMAFDIHIGVSPLWRTVLAASGGRACRTNLQCPNARAAGGTLCK